MRFYKDPVILPPKDEVDLERWKKDLGLYWINNLSKKDENGYHRFCEVIMGFHDMNEIHKNVCNFIQHDKHRFKLLLLPRLTFKSSVITQGYSLWRIFNDKNIRILIYSDSLPKAQGFLRGIKNHIEGRAGRSRFKELCGDWKGSLTWNELQATVSLREEGAVEPTIDTAGVDASKVGMHYDLIIFDDIVSDLNVTSKQQMDKVYDTYKRSHSLLKRNGEVLVVGTRWSFGDMYSKILAESNVKPGDFGIFSEEENDWGIVLRSAEEEKEDGSLIFDNIGEESLTQKHLDKLKERQGSYLYSALYCNNPVDDEESLFKAKDFQFYGSLQQSENPLSEGKYPGLYITCTIDPAGIGEDRTGGVVCGTDKDMKIYVLECVNRHLQPSRIADWVIEMHMKYRLRVLGIEEKFFQGMLKKELEKRIRDEQSKGTFSDNFRIEAFKPSRLETKFIRIQSLQPFHERGDITFPGNNIHRLSKDMAELAWQMMQVTPTHMPEPNDLVDAFAYHTSIVHAGGIIEKTDIPKNSPADLENRWVTEWNKRQKGLPRMKRRTARTWLS